jgi:hypothetical protein
MNNCNRGSIGLVLCVNIGQYRSRLNVYDRSWFPFLFTERICHSIHEDVLLTKLILLFPYTSSYQVKSQRSSNSREFNCETVSGFGLIWVVLTLTLPNKCPEGLKGALGLSPDVYIQHDLTIFHYHKLRKTENCKKKVRRPSKPVIYAV